MAVIWRERRADGTEEVVRYDFEAGTAELLSEPPPAAKTRHNSQSNGIVGGPDALARAKAMDQKLGVADRIRYVPRGAGRYDAKFNNMTDRRAWLRAHKRIDFDAGYGDAAPGDYRRNTPPEFGG